MSILIKGMEPPKRETGGETMNDKLVRLSDVLESANRHRMYASANKESVNGFARLINEIASLLAVDAAEYELLDDGTLSITVPNGTKVGRVLVSEEGTHIGGLHYPAVDAVEAETVCDMFMHVMRNECPCNYCDVDEWLPAACELIDECPNPSDKMGCWKQFIKHYPNCLDYMDGAVTEAEQMRMDGRRENERIFL